MSLWLLILLIIIIIFLIFLVGIQLFDYYYNSNFTNLQITDWSKDYLSFDQNNFKNLSKKKRWEVRFKVFEHYDRIKDQYKSLNTIKKFYEEYNIVIDPHTAIGVGAVEKLNLSDVVILSTAHPCKFPVAIEKAISKIEKLPESLNYINDKEEKFEVVSNDLEKVKDYVLRSI